MEHSQAISKAFRILQERPNLVWFGFWPAILDILVGGTIFFYQGFANLHHLLQPNRSILESLRPLLDFARENVVIAGWLAVTAALIFLLRLVVPVFCRAGLIFALDSAHTGSPLPAGKALGRGILAFLPFFEMTLVLGVFSLDTIFVEFGFAWRNLPPEIFRIIFFPLIFFAGFAILASLATVFAEFFLLLRGEKMAVAIGSSFRLVVENLGRTLILGLLLLTIGVRVLISALLVIGVPLALTWLTGNLLSLPLGFALAAGGLAGLFLLFFAGKLLGAMRVFVLGVWVETFRELADS